MEYLLTTCEIPEILWSKTSAASPMFSFLFIAGVALKFMADSLLRVLAFFPFRRDFWKILPNIFIFIIYNYISIII